MNRLPFETLKPPFPLYLRAFEALFHPRTEKNVISLNLVPSKRKATKKFSMNLSKKLQKKPSIFFACSENRPHSFLGPSANWIRTYGVAYGQKRCAGRKRMCGKPHIYFFLWCAGRISQGNGVLPNYNPGRDYVYFVRTGSWAYRGTLLLFQTRKKTIRSFAV